jgi:1,2-phenylacetyl-CoA epoxidase PaaB subunit
LKLSVLKMNQAVRFRKEFAIGMWFVRRAACGAMKSTNIKELLKHELLTGDTLLVLIAVTLSSMTTPNIF